MRKINSKNKKHNKIIELLVSLITIALLVFGLWLYALGGSYKYYSNICIIYFGIIVLFIINYFLSLQPLTQKPTYKKFLIFIIILTVFIYLIIKLIFSDFNSFRTYHLGIILCVLCFEILLAVAGILGFNFYKYIGYKYVDKIIVFFLKEK